MGGRIMKKKAIYKRILAVILCCIFTFSSTYSHKAIALAAEATSDTGSKMTFTSSDGKVAISLTEHKVNEYWYEYYIEVDNDGSSSICDWTLTVNISDVNTYREFFECEGTLNGNQLVITGVGNNAVVSAGSSVGSSGTMKIGFVGAIVFTNGSVTFSCGDQSSGNGNSGNISSGGSVGSGNTYLANYSCNYTLTGETNDTPYSETPVGKHGALSVDGVNLVDKTGTAVILRGVSTHGMHWGEMTPFVNKTAFQNLRDEWGVNLVRLVSYVTQGGYTQGSQESLDTSIQNGVQYASELGMYAIIDWHIHAENPNDTVSAAVSFFDKYSKMYAAYDNVIYEICNEPTGTPWPQIKSYAEQVVKTIRANDPDAIIIVGTNTWSQDVDEVATNGGLIDGQNIMYTVHFYSGSHGESLRNKVRTALEAGTPIYCTEFGICDASGNGNFSIDEANKWIDFFEENKISYTCWSLCNKNESASMISPESDKKYGWTNSDLGATGAWLINTYRKYVESSEVESTASPSAAPSVEPTEAPSAMPSAAPSVEPTEAPSATPSAAPSVEPTEAPSATPSAMPSVEPTEAPSAMPSAMPSVEPTEAPSAMPSAMPSVIPPVVQFKDSNVIINATASKQLYVRGINSTDIVNYKSSNTAVVKVENTGKITGVKEGTAKITVTTKSGLTAVCNVKVKKPAVKLAYTSLRLQVKKSTTVLKIKNKIKTDRVVSFKSSKKSIATVSKSGKITARKVGATVITVTMKSGVKVKCKVTVQKSPVVTKSIQLSKKTLVLKRNTTYQLKITRTPVTASDQVIFKSKNNQIATVNKKGKIKAIKKGATYILIKAGKSKVVRCKVIVK